VAPSRHWPTGRHGNGAEKLKKNENLHKMALKAEDTSNRLAGPAAVKCFRHFQFDFLVADHAQHFDQFVNRFTHSFESCDGLDFFLNRSIFRILMTT
jgi:hypothetical protein